MSRRVFISSASGALAPYRKAAVDVCHRLGLIPVFMEEFDPQRPPPADVCRDLVRTADVFVLLLAHRYGSRAPDGDLSYTELEYDWAIARDGLPLIPFVVDPQFPWPPLDVDRGADAVALDLFVARVNGAHLVKRFGAVDSFREDLLLALRVHEKSTRAEPFPVPPALHAVPHYVGSAPFTGRTDDLTTLDDWGRSDDPVMVVEAIGGTGKSALTWEWVEGRAPRAIPGLPGRLWWSFYDGSPSLTRFLREALLYVSRLSEREVRRMPRDKLTTLVLNALRERPFLLIMDGSSGSCTPIMGSTRPRCATTRSSRPSGR